MVIDFTYLPSGKPCSYRLHTDEKHLGCGQFALALLVKEEVNGNCAAKEHALLYDCLSQLEALNNACTFTHSRDLRDRLKRALGLPVLHYCFVCDTLTDAPLDSNGSAYCGCEDDD